MLRSVPAICVMCLASVVSARQPADHELARAARDSGRHVALAPMLEDAERRERGRVIDVEFDGDEYEIELLRSDGVVVELRYDARNGALKARDVEDDG